jgi:protein-S-isoprenylcysteine O-methyltransferase Ste14
MTILEQFVRDGDRLFRWRSYFPLVLVPVLVAGVFLEGPPFGAVGAERAWEVFSAAVALSGLAIRVWAVGTAPRGTSERSTSRPRASQLRTTGLYSMVRHPLYLANGIMALGIGLFPGVWYLPPIVVLGALLYYERIAAREEQFLDGLFGPAFREWASRVPAIVPRLAGWVPSTTAVSWRKILRGEFYGLLVITASVFVLDIAQAWSRSRTFASDPLWTWVFAATAAMFLVARTLKKHTRVLADDADRG